MNSTPSNNKNMSHQLKERRLDDDNQNNGDHLVSFDALSTDELVLIFEYLSPEDIMLARLNKKMRDAATKTVVPMDSDIDNAFHVDSIRKYHAMTAMAAALPNLQQIVIGIRDSNNHPTTFKYNDGEDPDEFTAALTANRTAHDIGILSNFTRLRELRLRRAPLNGGYPMLFNFPLLQKLHICGTCHIIWDLDMLAGLPSLKELMFKDGMVTGNIRSLRVLKDTLSKIDMRHTYGIRGNVMDLADFPQLKCLTLVHCGDGVTGDFEEISNDAFQTLETLQIIIRQNIRGNFMNLSNLPHLKVLNLALTAVTGDIRDIGTDNFLSLESLSLPSSVYGGCGFQFQGITDAPDIVAAVSTLMKQRPNLQLEDWYAELSDESEDRYEEVVTVVDADAGIVYNELFPPLAIEFVKAGSRLGWRWIEVENFDCKPYQCCEINWVDPEPKKESGDYENYIHELAKLEENLYAYKGFHQPPTEEEYNRIYSEYTIRHMRSET